MTKMTESKRTQVVTETRLKCRERVRKFREKKKQQPGNIELQSSVNEKPEKQKSYQHRSVHLKTSYKTDSALAKATTKLRKVLPSSPSKQKAVIAKLLHSFNDDVRDEIILNKTILKKGGEQSIDSDLFEEITRFYERDDISRMSPNTKDSRYYRNSKTGEKELKQKRYLVVTLKQAYDRFLIEHAGEFRPKF